MICLLSSRSQSSHLSLYCLRISVFWIHHHQLFVPRVSLSVVNFVIRIRLSPYWLDCIQLSMLMIWIIQLVHRLLEHLSPRVRVYSTPSGSPPVRSHPRVTSGRLLNFSFSIVIFESHFVHLWLSRFYVRALKFMSLSLSVCGTLTFKLRLLNI